MAAGVTPPPYTKDILRLAAGQEHYGRLIAADARVSRRSRTCGSTIALDLACDQGRVAAIAVRPEACAYGQAAATLMARHAVGKTAVEIEAVVATLREWLEGDERLPDWPEIDRLDPARARTGRHGAVMLPFEALAQAVKEAANGC